MVMMMNKYLTTDPDHPGLIRNHDSEPVEQAATYLVIDEEQRRLRGFVQPVRVCYVHIECGTITILVRDIAETYAVDPAFYHTTYCLSCKKHRPVQEFVWYAGHTVVGS